MEMSFMNFKNTVIAILPSYGSMEYTQTHTEFYHHISI